ncbi:MAG: deoxyribodipyrimidine photo-lyase [Pseudomonadota bacterium]
MTQNNVAIVWLRRDLRLHDNAALAEAIKGNNKIQPVFIFDSDILKDFPEKNDRRLSFITDALMQIDLELKKKSSGLLVLYGSAKEIIPKLAKAINANKLYASADYEPLTIERDKEVAEKLKGFAETYFVKDSLIFAPNEVLKDAKEPYKVFTPFSKIWLSKVRDNLIHPYNYDDNEKYADINITKESAKKAGLKIIELGAGAKFALSKINYEYSKDSIWQVEQANEVLEDFINNKSAEYYIKRDFVAENGTSKISPFLRFGLISIRQCVSAAYRVEAHKWLSELIWREFYAMILYHFPESVTMEWNPKYRGMLAWNDDEKLFSAWCEGKTGYPVVDAAMRQLKQEGWMHNRARMIVASFLTKDLQIDWRKGEKHFAKYLMDYDLASNVGGWQWAASTGTDAQPYFRVFNPTLQSIKFDPNGDYIRKYIPELKDVKAEYIHEPTKHGLLSADYYPQIVDHKEARDKAIKMFR